MTHVSVRNLSKRFGDKGVLSHLNLELSAGEFVAIVGRSGCGKSTLLRLIAGLTEATAGSIGIDGEPLEGLNKHCRVMFQDARLLPWKRARDNVTLGLGKEAQPRASELLQHVGLGGREREWPSTFSGGEKQRLALARALISEPPLLLLDEPLGALDALTRIEMQELLESLWLRRPFTALLITHDVEEAVALADRVVLLEAGQVALDRVVTLPRPRDRGSPEFAALKGEILERVMEPVHAHAA
jgi:sulfonate transport system ATP-binding protein